MELSLSYSPLLQQEGRSVFRVKVVGPKTFEVEARIRLNERRTAIGVLFTCRFYGRAGLHTKPYPSINRIGGGEFRVEPYNHDDLPEMVSLSLINVPDAEPWTRQFV